MTAQASLGDGLAGRAPGRVQPHDLAAEESVIGSLLLDATAIHVIRDMLEPEDFWAEKNANIYSAAALLADRGEPIDDVTLQSQLTRMGLLSRSGGIEYLTDLLGVVPTAANVKYYADIVAEHAVRRRLIGAGGEVATLGFDTTMPASDALDEAERTVLGIADQRRTNKAVHIAPLVNETWDAIETVLEKRQLVTGVPTNFKDLDSVTQGLQPGELIILAARPAVGKTSFALNVARNAAVLGRRPVVIFSLEMTRSSLVQRLMCSEANVDAWALKTGQADGQAMQRIVRAMDTLQKSEMWIDDTPALSISALRSRARRMVAQHRIELIVVDYLQLMHGGRQESRVQEVSDISSGLKSIAKELHLPVLALSQLSRESEKREKGEPMLSDLRDSGSIEQDADVVLFLFRPGMKDKEIDRSVTKLLVAKNRNGPVRDIDLHFIASQTKFSDVDHRQP